MKLCKRCNEAKSLNEFYKNLTKESRCKKCVSELRKIEYQQNRQKHIERARLRRLKFPERIKDGKLKQAFGIEYGTYDKMSAEQNGKCFICKKIPNGRLHVDHNHKTGKIRKLLCAACNTSLGLLKENIEVMQNMINYIKILESEDKEP